MDSQRTPMCLRAQNPDVVAAFLQDGVEIRVRLFGVSMKPLLGTGAVLRFSERVEPTVGDIVLLRFPNGTSSDKLVAHRVVEVGGGHVRTKGDASTTPDPPTPASRVLATATALETRPVAIPLRNPVMRALGLLLGRSYPRLARTYRTVWPKTPRKDALECVR